MSTVYLIPSVLHEEGYAAIPGYIIDPIRSCQAFFTENERTTRRFFKQLWKVKRPGENIVIDDYKWYPLNDSALPVFREKLRKGFNVGIISEAGCPGIADPGQLFVQAAQEMMATVKPLVGPSSVLLALMASGMNGQTFRFHGYLPIDNNEKNKAIRELEAEAKKKNITQIFIETPYRNNQLMQSLLNQCANDTGICVAKDITSANEWIKTKTVAQWKKELPELHKHPVIFLVGLV